MAALAVCAPLAAAGSASAARLHCTIPGGKQVTAKVVTILGDSDFVIDTDTLKSADWTAWSISGRPLALWLGPDSVAETSGDVVRISRTTRFERPQLLQAGLDLDRQDLPTETGAVLSIDTRTGKAEIVQHVTEGGDVASWAWEGSCSAAP
jgi:hypothetical protein